MSGVNYSNASVTKTDLKLVEDYATKQNNQNTLNLSGTSGNLVINNAVTPATSGGNAGLHLQVVINGQTYKIALQNP
jgi:hypothetical protein